MIEKRITSSINVYPLTDHFAAEIKDLDLRKDLTEQQVIDLHESMIKYKVLVIRNQKEVTPKQLRNFSKIWGDLAINGFTLTKTPVSPEAPFVDDIAGREDMQIFENHANSAVGRGNVWHTDVSYKKNPPAYTVLQSHILPDAGGDTLFMDMEEAVKQLPQEILSLIKTKRALHSGDAFKERLKKQLIANPTLKDDSETYHPLITKHPDTEKPILFYNIDLVKKISDSTQEESDYIIDTINKTLKDNVDMIYRHQWQAGDILIWDNRATMHYATYDYGKKSRLMYRTTIKAESAPQAMYI